ncbi:hypothetical protein QP150_19420 [Sphingomonas sp. 22L2VL55-3]
MKLVLYGSHWAARSSGMDATAGSLVDAIIARCQRRWPDPGTKIQIIPT